MTKKGKRAALLQRNEQIADLQRENEQLKARLAECEKRGGAPQPPVREPSAVYTRPAVDAFTICDSQMRVTDIDESALRYIGPGLRKEDIVGKDLADLVTDRERYERYLKVVETGERFTVEESLVLPDIGEVHVITRAFRAGDGLGILTSDVTAQKRMEKELLASEERSRLMLDNASEGVAVLQDGVMKYINPGLAAMSGFSIEEGIGKPFLELIHPDDRQTVADNYVKRLSGGEVPTSYQFRVVHKNGEARWAAASVTLFTWEGRPATLGMISDITERKRAEELLRASEEKYRTLADQSIQGIMIAQGTPPRVVYCNAAMADIASRTREEMLSLSPQQMADLVHPEDRDVFFKRFAGRLEGQPAESRYQIRGIRPDGAVRWLEVFATAVKYQDEPAVQAVFVDITERKLAEEKLRKSEERFRQITENMLDAISVTDEKGIIQYASPSHQTILGYKTEDLVGKSVFNYLCPEDMGSVMASLEGILEKREARYQYRFRHADGHWVWGEASAKLLLDDAGNASRFVIASRDISESKGMEESLKAGEEKYRRLFESTQTAMEVISLETGLVVLANEATARMFGFAFPDDLVGVDSMQYLRPEDVGWVSSKMAQAVGQNWQEIAELHVRTNDGRWIWVSGMTIATEYQGKPALLVSMLDITRLKQTEETLRASEEKFRLLTEKTNDLIFTADLNFKNTYVSPSVERILGFAPEEFSSRDITQQITPESLARAQKAFLEQLALEQEPKADRERSVRLEMEFYRKDGSTAWLESVVTGIRDASQTIVGVHGVARDITERRQAQEALRASEERFRTLIEKATDVVVVLDANGRTSYQSPSLQRITGYEPHEWVDKSLTDFFLHPDDLAPLAAALERVLAQPGAALEDIHARYRHKDGSWRFLEGTVTNMLHDPKVNGLVANFRDVTDRVQAEESLRASELKYKNLFDNTLMGMEVIDAETARIVLANRSIAQMFGFKSPEDMIGIDAVSGWVLPEDMERTTREIARSIADPERREVATLRARGPDGKVRWVSGMGALFEYDGKPALLISLTDVSSTKEAELKLQESEEKNRLVIDNATEGIAVVQDGILKFANRKFAESVGYSAQDLVNMSFVDFIHPDDRQKVAEYYFKRTSGQEAPSSYQFKWIDREGSVHWGEASIASLDWEGRPATLCMLSDITERKQAEQSLRASEERYRLLAENATDVIWTMDMNFRYTYISPSTTRLTGLSVEEAMVLSLEETLAPESYDAVSKIVAEELALEERRKANTQRSRMFEAELRRKDESLVWVEIQAAFLHDAARKATGILGVTRNITERKRAEEQLQRAHAELEARVEQRTGELREANALLTEEIRQRQEAQERLQESESRYRELVESANSVILELDTKGRITFFNRFAQEFFGFPESEIVGRHVVGTIAPDIDSDGKDRKAQTSDLIKHPENYLVIENEGVRRNGERVWISWTNKGLYDAKGRLRNILCIGMDRTEQKRVAEMLAQQAKEKAAVDERQRLARDLHDAVTQTLFSASLIAEVLPRLWKKDHEEGERRLEELRRLTRGALAEMRMLLLELRPAALGEVGLADLLRQLAEATTAQARLEVVCALRGTCSAPVDVQVALYRVAQEALNNVAKHSGATQAEITLTCREGSAYLTISDNGSGFDPKTVLPKSLGLRIMQERAEAIGAVLKVEGRPGRGARIKARWLDAGRKGES